MNKSSLIQKVSSDAHVKKSQAVRTIKSLVKALREAMKSGDKISLAGLGTFRAKARKSRKGRNPKTGAPVQIPPKKLPFFKCGKELKERVDY